MAKQLFAGNLGNGVAIEVLEAESFIGKTEFAVKVGDKVVSVSEVNTLRNGTIAVKTTAKAVRIQTDENEPAGPNGTAPTLSDLS